MNCINIASYWPPGARFAYRTEAFCHNKADVCKFAFVGTKFTKQVKLTSVASRHQLATTVCLFGGKGKPENGNEESPLKALEKAVGNFKKERSIEDVLRQQIQKQEFFDGGDNGEKPPSGGGGGSDGSSEDGNEGSEMWDEIIQVFLATFGFIFLYIYIIQGDEINVLTKDVLKFLFTRQKSLRLERLIDDWNSFFESMKQEEEEYDPHWLVREILTTPTWFDSPAKYVYFYKAFLQKAAEVDPSFAAKLPELDPTFYEEKLDGDRVSSDLDYRPSDDRDDRPFDDQDDRPFDDQHDGPSDDLGYKPPSDYDDEE